MNIIPNTAQTIWVCEDCMLHHANGECGGCYEDHPEGEPLNLLDPALSAMGMTQEDHECGRQNDDYFGECDCEYNSFSSSSCEGCGSYLHGPRHAMTTWEAVEC